VRWKLTAVAVGVVAVVSVAEVARRAAGDGFGLLLSEKERIAVIVTALQDFLNDRAKRPGQDPAFLHTGDGALTLAALAGLAESGRVGILPLDRAPPVGHEVIIVSRLNSWWPSTAGLRLTSYTGTDSSGYQYKFRRVAGRWEETDRKPVSRP